jgi:DNA-binding MarR family transcriptional regulator
MEILTASANNVAPTEQGQQAVESFLQQWREAMQGVLEILTPTEQLVLVELLNKLQKNWPSE